MIIIEGKHNTATVFTDSVEQAALTQIVNMCNQQAFAGSRVRIMPDVHAGKGCTIGTTMTITDKVVPNLVGVDIGCGVLVCELGKVNIDLPMLDNVIRTHIPSGFNIRTIPHPSTTHLRLSALRCYSHLKDIIDRAILSVGTLGGGNHFIELDKDDDGNTYLLIHSGSRHLGVAVANYYQREAYRRVSKREDERKAIIERCKAEGRVCDIADELSKLKGARVPEEFAYCEGELFDDYIHDMCIVQEYADTNRKAMAEEILEAIGCVSVGGFTTVHNYIDTDVMILRKGAVSAKEGERLIIPMNMRDGAVVCVGKDNEEWNCSAPHGAGRLMSRAKAKATVTLDEFTGSMSGIYTTSVNSRTIDESPMAYKPMDEILAYIGETVTVERIIKPIYNFKASV